MIVKCTNCGGSHPKWDCTKPLKESTAALKEVHHSDHGGAPGRTIGQQKGGGLKPSKPSVARNQASPVDTNIIAALDPSTGKDFGAKVVGRFLEDGRIEILSITHSKAKFSKSNYQKQYMSDKRAIKKLGLDLTVSQYRKSKGK